jgi:hypothetical protein
MVEPVAGNPASQCPRRPRSSRSGIPRVWGAGYVSRGSRPRGSHADQITRWVPRPFEPPGTDGMGRSDSHATLRRLFQVDAAHMVVAGALEPKAASAAGPDGERRTNSLVAKRPDVYLLSGCCRARRAGR